MNVLKYFFGLSNASNIYSNILENNSGSVIKTKIVLGGGQDISVLLNLI